MVHRVSALEDEAHSYAFCQNFSSNYLYMLRNTFNMLVHSANTCKLVVIFYIG